MQEKYVVLNDVRIADICLASLVYLFVYVNTNCVPIAHLRQNKPFPLVYLGHAQIIRPTFAGRGRVISGPVAKRFGSRLGQKHIP